MRIVDVKERSIAISRYADPSFFSGGLTTSLVAVVTDVIRDGKPVVGYGYASVGRFAQGGLIRERFAPRLLGASENAVCDEDGTNIDPFRAWSVMMMGEKPGGHGERCVAVGTLDMALWDAAAKIAGQPLHRFLKRRLMQEPLQAGGCKLSDRPRVRVYAGGGYRYPQNDLAFLTDEIRRFVDLGFTRAKIKIGGSAAIEEDLRRVEVAARQLADGSHLAVDAMNSYDEKTSQTSAALLAPIGLWWFEDICDPLDFSTLSTVALTYPNPIAAGEALFSLAEAKLLRSYGGLRNKQDILVFDPVHCYGIPGYLRIIDQFLAHSWSRHAFWPHGGHLFCLHLVAALGLGGAEVNPFAFRPFRALADDTEIVNGYATLPQRPGIGFEGAAELWQAFRSLA